MKVPQLLTWNGVSSKAKLVWTRIVFSRLTIIYFAFSSIHFVIQLGLQFRAFSINAEAASFLDQLLVQGDARTDWLPILRDTSISVCNWVSSDLKTDVETCRTIWSDKGSVTERTENAVGGFPLDPLPSSPASSVVSSTTSTPTPKSTSTTASPATSLSRAIVVTQATQTTTISVRPTTTVFVVASPVPRPKQIEDEEDEEDEDKLGPRALDSIRVEKDGKVSVVLTGAKGQAEPVVLDSICIESLNWPVSIIRNTKREDIVFIAFNFWVLGMSVVALLNESIPHIFASLLTHVMATAWAAFQISHTANFRASFTRVITEGACSSSPAILPTFWKARAMAEYPTLAMHIVSLLISSFLTWKLVKLFGWQTFKRVGASLTINRIYKIVLTMSITIQLSLFFMVVTVSLWIDQLMNSTIGDLATFTVLYKVSSFITLAVLVPWLCLGWVSVRRELRLPMFGFLVISVIYLAGWGVMFFATTFRWAFVTWRFFSVMASASVALTVLSFILGVICRFNFGKGLRTHLGSQESVEDDDQSSIYKEKRDIESFAFPAGKLVPTFASSYSTDEHPYHSEKPSAARGPRFFNQDAQPFDQQYQFTLAPPPAALTRNLTDVTPIKRSDSTGSDRTISTMRSTTTFSDAGDHSRNPSHSSQTKRWVIE